MICIFSAVPYVVLWIILSPCISMYCGTISVVNVSLHQCHQYKLFYINYIGWIKWLTVVVQMMLLLARPALNQAAGPAFLHWEWVFLNTNSLFSVLPGLTQKRGCNCWFGEHPDPTPRKPWKEQQLDHMLSWTNMRLNGHIAAELPDCCRYAGK